MKNNIMLRHIRKINKSIILLLVLLTLISFIAGAVYKQPILFLIGFFFVGITCLSLYSGYKKKLEVITSYIVSFIICCSVISTINGSQNIYMMLIPLSIVALYLNPRLFTYCSVLCNGVIIIRFLLTSSFDKSSFINFLLADTIVFTLMFLTKAGMDLIKSVSEEAQKATQSLEDLNKTMEVIGKNTKDLNSDISGTYTSLQAVKEISNSMTDSVQEVVVGVTNQADSIDHVYNMINTADEKALETQKTSIKLREISSKANQVVMSGSDRIRQMNEQMDIISSTVKESVTTVHELQDNMEEINNFLSGIIQISNQTNLLSLNASIEAARAGEAGKGFTVVANEVRKLADQSARTVNQIKQITDNINMKMQLVLDKVQSGDIAAKQGETIVNEVDTSFNEVKASFYDIDKYILTVQEMIENTTQVFNKIRNESEGMASIAEEHSAATQEMLSTMEEQNDNINNIFNLVKKIAESSENLRGTILEQ